MKIYHYHPETLELLGDGVANPSPANPTNFLLPAYATELEPPELKANQIAIFEDGKWRVIDDYRDTIFFDKTTKEEFHINELGIEPSANLTTKKPGEFDEWDENNNEWVFSLDLAQNDKIEQVKFSANQTVKKDFPYYKQLNINELQGYTEQDKIEMWEFINLIRDQTKKMVAEIHDLNDADKIQNFKIEFNI